MTARAFAIDFGSLHWSLRRDPDGVTLELRDLDRRLRLDEGQTPPWETARTWMAWLRAIEVYANGALVDWGQSAAYQTSAWSLLATLAARGQCDDPGGVTLEGSPDSPAQVSLHGTRLHAVGARSLWLDGPLRLEVVDALLRRLR